MLAMVTKDKKDSDKKDSVCDIDEDMGDEEEDEMEDLMDLYEQEEYTYLFALVHPSL